MSAFVKFFNYTPEGSMALAQALGVGRGVVTLIGIVEAAAAEAWPLALVVLAIAGFVLIVRRRELRGGQT